MGLWVGVILISLKAFAIEFPTGPWKEAEARFKILLIAQDLAVRAGRERQFDPSKALESCDSIDKERSSTFQNIRDHRLKAAEEASQNKPGWDTSLRADLQLNTQGSFTSAIEGYLSRWPTQALASLPCTDATSQELINNLASDRGVADEPAFGTCVRMVRAFRKSGECGKPVIQRP